VSVLEQALRKLDQAVAKAEKAAGHVETSLAGQQRDMFGHPTGAAAANSSESYIDGAVVADKLNSTIKKMETLLEEA